MTLAIRSDLVVVPNNATPADRSIEKRRLRKHLVLNVIRERGPLSRADISKISGYNLPNVSSLVDELVADDLVREEEARAVPRGRRPIPVYLNENYAAVLGMDVGRSSTISILVNLAGKVLARVEDRTPELDTIDAHVQWVQKVADRALKGQGAPIPPLCGIGVGLPGLILKETNGKGQQATGPASAISTALQARYGVPGLVENDARMMALGSSWFGEGSRFENFAIINIGQGIGLGVVLGGRVFSGKQGFGGELGYVPLGETGAGSLLGNPDALENIASGAGLMRLARRRRLKVRDVAELADAARKGSAPAREVFGAFAESLGRGISTVLNLLDPEAVILCGRVTRASDLFLEQTLAETRRHTLAPIFNSTQIMVSRLDVDLGPLGAAASILHLIFKTAHLNVDEVI